MTNAPERNGKNDFVTVPPGHKVVVIHAAEKAALAKCESGFWIVQLGHHAEYQSVLAGLRELVNTGQEENVIWIIPPEFLNALSDQAQFITEVSSIVENSRNHVGYTVVVPHASSEQESIMTQLKALGIGVHHSADDGACFVEVHKPEGIVVGMPGPAFDK